MPISTKIDPLLEKQWGHTLCHANILSFLSCYFQQHWIVKIFTDTHVLQSNKNKNIWKINQSEGDIKPKPKRTKGIHGQQRNETMNSNRNSTAVTSLSPFLRRLFTMKSLAKARGGDGSRGCRMTSASSGSPGATAQWSNICWQKAWPWVKQRKSVSKPKLQLFNRNYSDI